MNPVETYVRAMAEIRGTGVAVEETSYYPALSNLLNEVGKTLKPKVVCVINPHNQGVGLPDGGFFAQQQVRRGLGPDALFAQALPERGAMEVKGPAADVVQVAHSNQVGRYLDGYGLVLVTNYRDFVLMERGQNGVHVQGERYTLAETEDEFWREAAHPRRMAERHGERLTQYLTRVLLHEAPLVEPKDVAWFLASFARDAKARMETAQSLSALDAVKQALEEALGVRFEGDKGEHFFRSTLVQTLFYGLFSAWVLWSKQHTDADGATFNWHEAAYHLHVPMIRALFWQAANPAHLGALGLEEVMNWAGEALNRVRRAEFFARFEEEHAVQYFYEPFLQAFDPELRKELGVWYTPPEVVKYMVARVDTVLREELDVRDGLADPSVYVLDPCCGTGAYLVEVLRKIEETLRENRGDDALVPADVKRAATERVFGFEIMPAPFVVAHLQLGLLLKNMGAPLADERERAGVYLTNALTGWEPPREPQRRISYLELEQEREAAEEVKREKPILVILGNPPYNGFAGVSPAEEQGLVEPYKTGLTTEWGIRKFNLDDLYVRFFRLAERRIAEMTGRGIVCYISNFSYLSDPSYVVMRERFLRRFGRVWLDCMNGDSRETGKRTPDGKPDPSVFSTELNREGIRLGTVIGLFVKAIGTEACASVRYRDFWGPGKRAELLGSVAQAGLPGVYQDATPSAANRYSFRPVRAADEYLLWPRLVDLCGESPVSGLQEMRRGALIDVDRARLEARMREYFASETDWRDVIALHPGLAEDAGRFRAEEAWRRVRDRTSFNADNVVRYALYPLDTRWCYHSSVRPLWNEPRPALAEQAWQGNAFVLSRMFAERPQENAPVLFARVLPDYHLLRPNCVAIPMHVKRGGGSAQSAALPGMEEVGQTVANLSVAARAYLAGLGCESPDEASSVAALVWLASLAATYAPAYLEENGQAIRQDWPRIPLPDTLEALEASAELGRRIAALLDTENEVEGVTTGSIREDLREIGPIQSVAGHTLNPDTDLAVTAGWGHAGQGGVTMPAKGKLVERLGSSSTILGDKSFDIYLNDKVYWKNIPSRVWNYHIGGYQVIKKWLSYREKELLGRDLTIDEARYVTNMARRIAAIVLMEPELDANYERVKASCYAWPREAGQA